MRAVLFREFGPPSVLQIVADHPRPVRRPGELLVKVVSTSVNPVDWKTRRGDVPHFLVARPYKVPGGDVSGVVVDADADARFPPGSRVFACTDGFKLWRREGAYAEYATVPESQAALVPPSLPLVEAGGLPLVSLTAFQSLEAAGLQPGQRLLVHAGAGGVGSACVQMAKARGLHVTATCSARNAELVRELGADAVVDYTSERFEDAGPFDGVVDPVGGDVETRSLALLPRGGSFVSVLNSGWLLEHGQAAAGAIMAWSLVKAKALRLLRLGPHYTLLVVKPSGEQLARVARLVEEGRLRAVVDRVLPLEEAAEAHAYGELGHSRGKVILRVAEDAE